VTDKEKQERLKMLTAKVVEAVKQSEEYKEDNGRDDVLLTNKVNTIVTEQLSAMDAASEKTRKDEFDKDQETMDEFLDEQMKMIDNMDPKDRVIHQKAHMLYSKERLSDKYDSSIAQRIEDFKYKNDTCHLTSTMLYLAAKKKDKLLAQTPMEIVRNTEAFKGMQNMLNGDVELRKALAVANSAEGAEWIPTGFSNQVTKVIELNLKVPSLFRTIPMPTSPWKMPVQLSQGTGYFVNESNDDESQKIPASTPGTSAPEFTARKLAGRFLFSEEIDEDSIVNMRSFLVDELGMSIARAEETAFVNGDRTGAAGVASSHQDNAGTALFTSNYDARLIFDGLRYFALNNADTSTKTFGNADPSDTLLSNVRLLMGKHAVNPQDLVWIASINTYLKMIGLTNARTIDKYGDKATVLTGELMKYDGIPVVVSEYLYSNLADTGVYDGSTTDRAMLLLCYTPGFLKGTRGGVTLATDLDIERDQIILVGKNRLEFKDIYDALLTGNVQCAAGINIKTS